jgi:uncharacterized protein YkwD
MFASLVLGFAVASANPTAASASSALLADLNRTRVAHGLAALSSSAQLAQAAQLHAQDMIQNGYFAHESRDGKTPFDRMRLFGISFRFAGENIAMAPSEPVAAQSLYQSAPHRENMLDPQYRHVGIAAMQRPDGELFFVEDFSD